MEFSALERETYAALKAGDTTRIANLMSANPSLLAHESALGTWLHIASRFGNLASVECLVDLGLDVNRRGGTFGGGAVHEAASGGFIEIVKHLLAHGAELDDSEPHRNPLWGAIYGGHLDVVEVLLARGMDPSVRYSGESMTEMNAFDFAVERGHSHIAALLAKRLEATNDEA